MNRSSNAYKYESYYDDTYDNTEEYYYTEEEIIRRSRKPETVTRAVVVGDWDVLPKKMRRQAAVAGYAGTAEKARKKTARQSQTQSQAEIRAIQEKRKRVLADCLMVFALFLLFAFGISRQAEISSINLKNVTIKEQITKLDSAIEQKSVEIAAQTNLQEVQAKAENELGMQFPNNDQVRYIRIEDTDAPVATADANADGGGFLETLGRLLSELFG